MPYMLTFIHPINQSYGIVFSRNVRIMFWILNAYTYLIRIWNVFLQKFIRPPPAWQGLLPPRSSPAKILPHPSVKTIIYISFKWQILYPAKIIVYLSRPWKVETRISIANVVCTSMDILLTFQTNKGFVMNCFDLIVINV